MTYRVSLIKSFGHGFSSDPVDFSTLSELKKALRDRGAKTFQLSRMSYQDSWEYKGDSEAIAKLSAAHVKDLIQGEWDLSYWRD
jgi:hypothetical protein